MNSLLVLLRKSALYYLRGFFKFQLSKDFLSWGNWGLNIDFGKHPERKLIRT